MFLNNLSNTENFKNNIETKELFLKLQNNNE